MDIQISIQAEIHIHTHNTGDSQALIDKLHEVTLQDRATTDNLKHAVNPAESPKTP